MKAHKIIKSVLTLSLAVIAVSSCQEKINGGGFTKGEAVRFSIGTDVVDTKAVYSDATNDGKERIDWQTGDLIRIYCEAVSEPEEKYSDYVVTEVFESENEISKARIGHTSLGQLGLRWGEGPHTFYAVYPSPEDDGSIATSISIDPYADGGTKSSVAKSITGPTVKAKLPAAQDVIGDIATSPADGTIKVAAPDLKNMLMTAKSKTYTEASGITDEVFLSFIPLTTAVQFTITNQTGKDIKIKSVSMISGNGKATAPAINGAFSVNLDSMSKPADINLGASTITYSRQYPACTRDASLEATTSMGLRTSTISFDEPVPLTYNATAASASKLTFTFFLTPTCNFDDITFKVVMTDSEGNNPRWMSTKLGYTDGTGVLFPRFKKTTVNGVFLPKGAQWTIKYGPNVVSWNAGGNTPIDPMAEVTGDPVVTSWDTGILTDLELEKQPVDLFSVSATKKVRFAQGNLYWDGNSGEYKFEENQYDYRCFRGHTNDEAFINGVKTTTPENTVGLFYGVKNTETSNTPYASTYGTPAPADAGTDILFTNEDVDTPNPNFTVDSVTGKYRTLSSTEWTYLFNKRTVNGGKGIGKSYSLNVTYCGQKGVVIYPDYYSGSPLSSGTDYSELPEGSVFLPFNGFRFVGTVTMNYCVYWGSDAANASEFHLLLCNNDSVSPVTSRGRNLGFGIRLVSDVE